jgi:thiamine biosynthesis lipoprotein
VSDLAARTVPALGTSATVVVADKRRLDEALAIVLAELDAIDGACSRFRSDSEIARVNTAAGREVAVTSLFLQAVEVGLRAAVLTDGLVDPTVGSAMRVIGYDRDFSAVAPAGPPIRWDLHPVPGWQAVELDAGRGTVKVPAGVELDLGATAKALCADRAAARAFAATETGVLVSLGGDLSTAGVPPDGGWIVQLTDDHADPIEAGGPAVSIVAGGLATSSTSVRRWTRGERTYHHLVDPRTGAPAEEYWRTVTVAAASCVDANTASTAAVVLGPAALDWLDERGLPARLVDVHGGVATAGGWLRDLEPVAAHRMNP